MIPSGRKLNLARFAIWHEYYDVLLGLWWVLKSPFRFYRRYRLDKRVSRGEKEGGARGRGARGKERGEIAGRREGAITYTFIRFRNFTTPFKNIE